MLRSPRLYLSLINLYILRVISEVEEIYQNHTTNHKFAALRLNPTRETIARIDALGP